MKCSSVSRQDLAQSVIAVPPLCRSEDRQLCAANNRRLIQHLERGGVRSLLYGGNAVLHHMPVSEYEHFLQFLENSVGSDTLAMPSAGPTFGMMVDQARILSDYSFPTTMLLPQKEVSTPLGVARAVRHFVEVVGKPIVLYLKHDGYVDAATVRKLVDEQLVSWIKYAVVRDDPAQDDYLRELVDQVDPALIVSGIGEQPAVTHMRQFGLVSFTSGCVCVAPELSMRMLKAIQESDWDVARSVQETMRPLEDLRNRINPIRVLQAAVEAAELAVTGPIQPLLSEVTDPELQEVQAAAQALVNCATAK